MAKHMVTCRVCKQKFDFNDPNIPHEKPSKNFYYHKKCYDDWKRAGSDPTAEMSTENWHEIAKEFLSKDMRMSVDWEKFESQWKNFLKPNYSPKMTAKGMYFALKYHYDVQHGSVEKAVGGIGIIPHIYEESCRYWVKEEQRHRGIVAKIEAQAKARLQQKQVVVKQQKKDKARGQARFSLEDVEDDE